MAEEETKHTPGPWNKETIRKILRFARKNPSAIGLDDRDLKGAPNLDDLDVIAAAQEMLEVLQMVPYGILHDAPNDPQPCMCDQCKFHKAVKIVLDKAEGRPLE